MEAKQSRSLLIAFFEQVKASLASIPDDKINKIGVGDYFTDVQTKQMFAGEKRFYCFNLAVLTETEKTRAELMSMIGLVLNTLGKQSGRGFEDAMKKLHAYSGDKKVF